MKVKSSIWVVLLCLLAAPAGYAQSDVATRSNLQMLRSASQNSRPTEQDFIRRVQNRYLPDSTRIRSVRGPYEVEQGDIITGDLLVINGPLTLRGQVVGKVLVINGDIFLARTARVSEDVVSVNGKIHRDRGAKIGGEMVEASFRRPEGSVSKSVAMPREEHAGPEHGFREWREKPHHVRWKRREHLTTIQPWENLDESLLWRYNRVEGLFLGINFPPAYGYKHGLMNLDLNGSLGYGLANKAWRYRIAAEMWFFSKNRILLGATAYDLTDTQDEWRIPTDENSLAASLIHEDFQDYFRREGYGFYLAHHLSNRLKARFGFFNERFYSLSKHTEWALFGGGKRFRENPAIDTGNSHAYKASLVFDTRDRRANPTTGWLISTQAEFSRPALGSDFDFDRWVIDVRRYIPLAYGENLDIRLRAATSRGHLPLQYRYYLGGLSTLRALGYKQLSGDRLVLANIEYSMHSWSERLRHSDLLNWINLVLFVDSGWAWFAPAPSSFSAGFEPLKFNQLVTDIGFALTDDDGSIRLNFARRIDGGRRDLVITFRLNRPF
ncbi:MAG: hypothetical protein D6814_02655 [Calditrichaeota bacterium]|nr:MAG: hypothetical protein D6814_02655 [Calditrichota bacterium]